MMPLNRHSRGSSSVLARLDPAIQPEVGTRASLPWMAAARAGMTKGGHRSCR